MRILGISGYYHDSAAALTVDGRVMAAAQEERFTRKKHDSGFPHNAIRSCLAIGGVKPSEIDHVAFYDKPFLKFERLLETYLAFAPRGFSSFREALPVWVKDKLFQRHTLLKELDPGVDWARSCSSRSTTSAMRRVPSTPRRSGAPRCSPWMGWANGPPPRSR
jgi:carbamoyltransferase